MDSEGRIIGLLAGRPRGEEWDQVVAGATKAIERTAKKCSFSEGEAKGRRGVFAALSVGISFGGGQTVGTLCLILLRHT